MHARKHEECAQCMRNTINAHAKCMKECMKECDQCMRKRMGECNQCMRTTFKACSDACVMHEECDQYIRGACITHALIAFPHAFLMHCSHLSCIHHALIASFMHPHALSHAFPHAFPHVFLIYHACIPHAFLMH